jgi:hypothetical protein
MPFEVNLIRVPYDITEEQQAELEANCRYINGGWWIFEGDEDALDTPIRIYTTGVTPGVSEEDIPPGQPIIDHAVKIFHLSGWPPTIPYDPAVQELHTLAHRLELATTFTEVHALAQYLHERADNLQRR